MIWLIFFEYVFGGIIFLFVVILMYFICVIVDFVYLNVLNCICCKFVVLFVEVVIDNEKLVVLFFVI